MKINRLIVMVTLALTASLVVNASVFKPATISAEAEWFVHIDGDEIAKSRTGRYLGKFISGLPDFLEFSTEIKNDLGIDIHKDIHGITVYGKIETANKSGIILVNGDFDSTKINMACRNGIKKEEYNKHSIILKKGLELDCSNNGNSNSYMVVYNKNMLIYSSQTNNIKLALDVLDKRKPNIKTTPLGKIAQDIPPSEFLVIAINIADARDLNPAASIIRKTETAAIGIGESGSNITANIILNTDSKEDADSLRKMVEGMIAFASVSNTTNNNAVEYGLKNIIIKNKGNRVTATWSYPIRKAIENFETEIAKGADGIFYTKQPEAKESQ